MALSPEQMEEGYSSQESTERDDSRIYGQKNNILSATSTSLKSKMMAGEMKEEALNSTGGMQRM